MAVKPAFREAYRQRRGLMPADLFYEWQVIAGQKVKQPWCFRLPDAAPFAFGALWERWRPNDQPDAIPLVSCTIITTEPNDVVAPVHDRMPLIIAPSDYETWLDPRRDNVESLVRPYDGVMEAWPVSPHVNKPAFDDPACIEPLM